MYEIKEEEFEFETIQYDRNGRIINQERKNGRQQTFDLGKGMMFEMVYIPAGTFLMGQTDEEQWRLKQWGCWEDHLNCERPCHQVRLNAFAISKYPVTQAQWQAIMGNNPSSFHDTAHPVENVSWNDTQVFLTKLNDNPALHSRKYGEFRLPTESEWEYACRAGTRTIWPFDNDPAQAKNYAWYDVTFSNQTQPVCQLKPNEWGLYDMLGNVSEWCEDIWHETYNGAPTDGSGWWDGSAYRVLRGGSWKDNVRCIRSASRWCALQSCRDDGVGVRLVIS